jgi:hypothetical protein
MLAAWSGLHLRLSSPLWRSSKDTQLPFDDKWFHFSGQWRSAPRLALKFTGLSCCFQWNKALGSGSVCHLFRDGPGSEALKEKIGWQYWEGWS